MDLMFALIGNQNSGKTTLFNQLTGSNQHVGNFPGVTVDKKVGIARKRQNVSIVDLPGIYSLSPYTSEEIVTRDFLINEKPDCIINIIDATNIERNLYLTMQLIELEIPMVIALNMMDEVRKSGSSINIERLSNHLGLPVMPISASKNEGVTELLNKAVEIAENKTPPLRLDFCEGPVHKAIHAIAHLCENNANKKGLPKRFCATKLVEGDEPMIRELGLTSNELDILGHFVDEMERDLGMDREAALADMRYTYLESLCKKTVHKAGETNERIRSRKIDAVLTHKFFAIPIFICIMLFVFWMTFSVIGGNLSDLLSDGVQYVTSLTDNALTDIGVNSVVHSLIIDGIFTGVGSILSFLPIIVTLFFFLSLLEDSGYMARVAFVMDKLLRKIGLSGRSFVPMLIGFGCSVPAIMSTRTLSSERDRKMTIILTPFMSCSAKLPVYTAITAAFFPENGTFVMAGLYILGMAVGILVALFYKKTVFRGKPVPFVMELPAYRFPSFKSVILLMWEKASDFIKKAFTIILVASVIVWFLQKFDPLFNIATGTNSMLSIIGRVIAPVFVPLGFGRWELSTALLSGLTAKEAVISTLSVIIGANDASSLQALLPNLFGSTAGVISFLVFTLLYMPCVAAMAAIKREFNSFFKAAGIMVAQTALAWVVAFLVYNVFSLIL